MYVESQCFLLKNITGIANFKYVEYIRRMAEVVSDMWRAENVTIEQKNKRNFGYFSLE